MCTSYVQNSLNDVNASGRHCLYVRSRKYLLVVEGGKIILNDVINLRPCSELRIIMEMTSLSEAGDERVGCHAYDGQCICVSREG